VHPGVFAAKEPQRPAVIMGTAGTVVTYAELEARSNQAAWLARSCGLRPGDGMAVIAENRPEMFDLAWGAQRSGLQFTAVNWHLTAEEAGYMVADSGARIVVVGSELAGLAAQLDAVLDPGVRRLMLGGTIPGWDSYEAAAGAQPSTPVPDECEGDIMLYSSGTTGKPKGIRRPVGEKPLGEHADIPGHWLRELLGMNEGDVYLSRCLQMSKRESAYSSGSLALR
jgi:long-chain acyl-CoA synthetase